MLYLEWNEKFETGISEVDFQHRNLVNMINNLAKNGSEPPGEARNFAVRITLEQLIDYTVYHFKAEEALMHEAKYAHEQEHHKAHELLKSRALGFAKKIDEGEDVLNDLLAFLKEWLQKHILITDMQYVADMKAAGLGI